MLTGCRLSGRKRRSRACSALNEKPVPPRRIRPRVLPKLEAICLRCLQKAPIRLYAIATRLDEDLRDFLKP